MGRVSGMGRGRETGRNALEERASAGALTAVAGSGMVARWVPGGPGRWLLSLIPIPKASNLAAGIRDLGRFLEVSDIVEH